MSFDAIFGRYSKIREHVKKQPIQGAYEFVTQRLERAQDLLQMWLAVYELYAKGYNEEITSFSTQSQIGHLSICGRVVEEALAGIFNARIPKEAYVFLDNVLKELSYDSNFYVLVESDDFSQGSVYKEIFDRSLKNLLGTS